MRSDHFIILQEESKAYNAYSKTLRDFRKAEFEFFAAQPTCIACGEG